MPIRCNQRSGWPTSLENLEWLWVYQSGTGGTSIIAVIPVAGAGLLGIVPLSELTGLECGLSCAFMVIAMLLRIDHYTAGYLSHEGHVHAT